MSECIKIGERVFTVLFPDALRPLNPDEEEALKESIKSKRRVFTPIICDENDGVIDGINRLRQAAAAGLDEVPVNVIEGLSQEEKEDLAYDLNDSRRHLLPAERLTAKGKRDAIREALKADPERSNRQIAEEAGVDHKTVKPVREELSRRGEIPHVETHKDTKGRKQPAKKPLPQPGQQRTFPDSYPSEPTSTRTAAAGGDAAEESPIICPLCFKNGKAKRGCPSCEALRKQAKEAADRAEANEPEPEHKDDAGEIIPEHVLPAFAAAGEIGTLCRDIDAIVRRAEALALGTGGRLIRFESVKQQLKDARGNLWANRATHVCPYCKATEKKCEACKGQGWVAKHIYDQAPSDTTNSTKGREKK